MQIYLYVAFAFISCAASKGFKTSELVLVRADGQHQTPIIVEIAETEAERQQGLMLRKELADGKGMIFLFEKDQILSFWMKNTFIPLSIAFISSDGHILEIRDMEPQNLSVVHSARSCRYALEVPQGWFGRAGIGVGDKILLDNLKKK